jgi:exosortase/archaeosortase family protein
VLVAFPFVPRGFTRERNFALLFFAALSVIFVVPLMAIRAGHDATGSVDEYTAALVTPQLSALLNALGNPVWHVGNDVHYVDLAAGRSATVHIATQCSGLYSMAIFIAAFSALVMSDYPRLTRRVGALLAAGIFLAYLANLLRMVVIVEAGHYYGSEALVSTHANLGDIIFLAWVAPFMWLAYRYLDPRADERDAEERARMRAAAPPSAPRAGPPYESPRRGGQAGQPALRPRPATFLTGPGIAAIPLEGRLWEGSPPACTAGSSARPTRAANTWAACPTTGSSSTTWAT